MVGWVILGPINVNAGSKKIKNGLTEQLTDNNEYYVKLWSKAAFILATYRQQL